MLFNELSQKLYKKITLGMLGANIVETELFYYHIESIWNKTYDKNFKNGFALINKSIQKEINKE